MTRGAYKRHAYRVEQPRPLVAEDLASVSLWLKAIVVFGIGAAIVAMSIIAVGR